MELKAAIAPAYLKIGCFGHTGTGKTWTMAQLLSQFIAEYVPDSQLAMFDTEYGSGYVEPLVKRITGKPLLAIHAHSFSELLEFSALCRKNNYVALLDSATHVWRNLCTDFLDAKKSRVKAAGGNPGTTRLSLSDWGPIKDVWSKFSNCVRYDPVHWGLCGREGDVWEQVADDEGKTELTKTGEKMKTETELGYEPSILVRMKLINDKAVVYIKKERFGVIAGGASCVEPDIEFFRPHIELLNLGGQQSKPDPDAPSAFPKNEKGMNWETIKARREAILDEIKDDLILAYPGQDKDSKKGKIEALRHVFQTSSWTGLEKDHKAYPVETLLAGRDALHAYLSVN